MITKQTYALLALNVYQASTKNTVDLPSAWIRIPQPSGTDGFAYAVYQNTATKEVVISFRGTDNDFGDWTTNLGLSLSQEKQAAAVYSRVLHDLGTDPQGSNITFTGHSLGGGLAGTMAVWFNRTAVVFDPAPTEITAKNEPDVAVVIASLGTSVPQAIQDYGANITTQFVAREANVSSYFAPGSIVYAGSTEFNTITGAGQRNPVQFGIANMGGPAAMVDMHSQALLTAGLLSDGFRAATVSVQSALPLIMSKQLYALSTGGSDRNFLIDLIRSEQKASSGQGKLTHFAADLQKLGTNIAGLTVAAQDALIAQGIEWYYWQGNNYTGKEFFSASGGALQYTTAKGAELADAQNKAASYVNTWLNGLLLTGAAQSTPSNRFRFDSSAYQQWNVTVAGSSSATAKDSTKTQLFVGAQGADSFVGGDKNDTLFAQGGADTLNGGAGNDKLFGGDGTDTYQFDTAWGKDTIQDSDGLGNLTLDGAALTGGKGVGKINQWASKDSAGNIEGYAVTADSSSSTGYKLTIVKGTDTANTITVNNFDFNKAKTTGYLGIKLDSTQLAISTTGQSTPFAVPGTPITNANLTVNEGGGKALKIYLSCAAKAGDTVTLSATGSGAAQCSAILGDSTVPLDGAVITLKEGQTEVDFALTNSAELTANADLTLKASYTSTDPSGAQTVTSSNSAAVSLIDGGVTTRTYNGDQRAPLSTGGTYEWGSTAWQADGSLTGGVAEADFADVIYASGGNDTVNGLGGNDALDGGAGNDSIDGGAGDDLIGAGAGSDEIQGGDGNDIIVSATGLVALQRNKPTDAYTDMPVGSTVLRSGPTWAWYYSDRTGGIVGGASSTAMDSAPDVVDGGAGDDLVIGGLGADLLKGGTGDDGIFGHGSDDILEGGDGADQLDGDGLIPPYLLNSTPGAQHGNDFLDGGAGNDQLFGAGKNDTLFGGTGDDQILGDDTQANLDGQYHGNDYLDGEEGNDQLKGGGKDDILLGGTGNDAMWGDDVQSKLDGQYHGNDYLDGGDGNDQLVGDGKDDTLLGGSGDDAIWGDDTQTNLDGQYHGNDYLDGGEGTDELRGGGADDTLIGGSGADLMWGDDTQTNLNGQYHANDYLDGGEGNDELTGGGADDTLIGGVGDDLMRGDDTQANLDGTYHGKDYLDGGDGNDQLVGDGNDDTLYGGAGDDTLIGDDDVSKLDAQFDGNDYLAGGDGNDSLYGNGGNDVLLGGSGDDYLEGGDSNDTLNGGTGANVLLGGAGDDTYVYDGVGQTVIDDTEGHNTVTGVAAATVHVTSDGGIVWTSDATTSVAAQTGREVAAVVTTQPAIYVKNALTGGGNTMSVDGASQTSLRRYVAEELKDTVQLNGTSSNQTYWGGAGNDSLQAFGDHATVSAGRGDDLISLGASGTLQLDKGDGSDTVYLSSAAATDRMTLEFGAGITAADIKVSVDQANNQLVIQYSDAATDRVTVGYTAGNPASVLSQLPVGTVKFADGSTADLSSLMPQGPTILGTQGVDEMLGSANADRLEGLAGGDWIKAGAGDDVLVGGTGNDLLQGEAGNDVYILAAGDGHDTITDSQGETTVRFAAGITPASITVRKLLPDSAGDRFASWQVSYGNGDKADLILGKTASAAVHFEFADGTVLTKNQIIQQLLPNDPSAPEPLRANVATAGDDVLIGTGDAQTLDGGAGDDVLFGQGGADYLMGGTGNDELDGGSGDDQLDGGSGSNTYYVGRGMDLIVANTPDETAGRVVLDTTTALAQLAYGRRGNNLVISVPGTANGVTLTDFWVNGQANSHYTLEVSGGAAVNLATQISAVSVLNLDSALPPVSTQTWESDPTAFKAAMSQQLSAQTQRVALGDTRYRSVQVANPWGGTGTYTEDVGLDPLRWPDGTYTRPTTIKTNAVNVNASSSPTILTTSFEPNIGPPVQKTETWVEQVPVYATQSGFDVRIVRGRASFNALLGYSASAGYIQLPAGAQYTTKFAPLDPNTTQANATDMDWEYILATPNGKTGQVLTGFTEVTHTSTYTTQTSDPKITLQNVQGDSSDNRIDAAAQNSHANVPGLEGSYLFDASAESHAFSFFGTVDGGGGNDHINLSYDLNSQRQTMEDWYDTFNSTFYIDHNISNHLLGKGAYINAGDGNDEVWGTEANDDILLGAGNDFANGGTGSDTYYVGAQEGNDVILDGGTQRQTVPSTLGTVYADTEPQYFERMQAKPNLDTVVFGQGITLNNLQISAPHSVSSYQGQKATFTGIQSGGYLLDWTAATVNFSAVDISWGQVGSSLQVVYETGHVPNGIDAAIGVDKFRFADGSEYSLADLLARGSVNHVPTVATALTNKTAIEDSAWTFAVPAGSFADTDPGDVLTYSATLSDGSTLPSWLSFNAATQSFSGTPLNANVGTTSLKVTATDKAGLAVSSNFDVVIANTNDAPVVAHAVSAQSATSGQAFSYALALTGTAATFTDEDVGDVLTYSAKLASGAALPSWLSFNAATGQFSGTPTASAIGAVNVQVTATDKAGATATSSFALNVVAPANRAPTVATALTNKAATEDSAWTFAVPAGTFTDPDISTSADVLTYSATLASGAALPSWLSFNAATQTFSGTPLNANVGTTSVKVVVTDKVGLTASSSFDVVVANTNDAPVVAHALVNQAATSGQAFSYAVPLTGASVTFTDEDVGDVLTYSAKLSTGATLPSWLSFNASTGQFSGTPTAAGTVNVQVTATDVSGATASSSFAITVAAPVDTTAPTLASAVPADNATAVAVGANVVLTFSEAIKAGTGNLVLVNTANAADSRTIAITDTAQVTISGSTVTINPTADLVAGASYAVQLPVGVIKDIAGNNYAGIADTTTLNFATAGAVDTTAPTLASAVPADNATAVAVGANVVLTFNEAIKAGTGNLVLVNTANAADNRTIAITDTTQVTISGSTLTINPTANLLGNANYSVQMAAGVVKDVAGNNYAGISSATALNFGTAANDTVAPTLSSAVPADNATAVAVGANVVLTFSEAIQKGTGNLVLVNAANAADNRTIAITDTTQVTISGNTVTINPSFDLQANGAYSVQLAAGVIKDIAGNNYAGIADATTLNFATAAPVAPAAGADVLVGTANVDILTADATHHELWGQAGNDTLNGFWESTRLVGGAGNDIINAQGGGANVLDGGDGDDTLSGSWGQDIYMAGAGNNKVTVIGGASIVTAGAGNDNITGIWGSDIVFAGNGTNTIDSGGGYDLVQGGTGIDTIVDTGGGGHDWIDAGAGADVYTGGVSTAYVVGGLGNDTLNGGSNTDTYFFAVGNGVDTVNDLGDPTNQTRIMLGAGITPASLIVQTSTAGLLLKTSTTDSITLKGFNASVANTACVQVMFADGTVWSSKQLLNAVTAKPSATAPASNSTTVTASGLIGTYVGTANVDTLTADATHHELWGQAGNDTLNGFWESTRLIGGAGNDTLIAQGGDANVLDGGDGDDVLTGGWGFDILMGGAGNNTITGSSWGATITAGAGNDSITGLAGEDVINAGDGNNTLNAGGGDDTIWTGSGTDIINGGAGGDIIFAGAGNDNVNGGDADDTIVGGTGDDTLNGGAGTDTFRFAIGDGNDLVTDLGLNPGAGNAEATRLVMGAGIASTNLVVQTSSAGLVIKTSGTDSITLQGLTAASASTANVQVIFDDGTVWTTQQLMAAATRYPALSSAMQTPLALNQTVTQDAAPSVDPSQTREQRIELTFPDASTAEADVTSAATDLVLDRFTREGRTFRTFRTFLDTTAVNADDTTAIADSVLTALSGANASQEVSTVASAVVDQIAREGSSMRALLDTTALSAEGLGSVMDNVLTSLNDYSAGLAWAADSQGMIAGISTTMTTGMDNMPILASTQQLISAIAAFDGAAGLGGMGSTSVAYAPNRQPVFEMGGM